MLDAWENEGLASCAKGGGDGMIVIMMKLVKMAYPFAIVMDVMR